VIVDHAPVTFDAGALIAIERGDAFVRSMSRVLAAAGVVVLIPAVAIVEVWRGGARRQARLATFLNDSIEFGHIRIVDLDFETAKQVGVLLARAPMSVADAVVCHCALGAGGQVVTSDPHDIGRLIPRDRIKVV